MSYPENYVENLRSRLRTLFYSKQSTPPIFPHFKEITFEDRDLIETSTGAFLPYSDFNFISAYTWNVDGKHAFCFDGKNLVLKLSDYVTGQPVFTVLGDDNVQRTIEKVIIYISSIEDALLKLLPEATIQALDNTFIPEEDQDNHDYIFSLQELSTLDGRRYKNKRHAANKCEREARVRFESKGSITHADINSINLLTEEWERQKNSESENDSEAEIELQALKRVFTHFNDHGSLLVSLAYENEKIVGFSVDECLKNSYVVSHYFKTLPSVPGLSEHFNRYVANVLHNKGYTYWNWEQDLGIVELRQMKNGYRPTAKLKKYFLKNCA